MTMSFSPATTCPYQHLTSNCEVTTNLCVGSYDHTFRHAFHGVGVASLANASYQAMLYSNISLDVHQHTI